MKYPKGIKENGKKLMLDFGFKGGRYRVTTTFLLSEVKKAEKLLNSIKLDLERNLFNVEHYSHNIISFGKLIELDPKYQAKNNSSVKLGELIDNQLVIYDTRVENKTLHLSTKRNLVYIIRNHIKPYFADFNVNEVTISDIENFISKLNVTRARVNKILQPLKSIMVRALRQGLIDKNPFDKFDKDIISAHIISSDYEVDPFSQEEIEKILAACKYQSMRNIIQTGFWTGMRLGELFALEWGDIDFKNEIIFVQRASSINGIIKEPKTKAGIRKIEMTPKAKEALLSQFEITGKDEDNRVFKSPKGKIWTKTDNLGRNWRIAINAAGVRYRNPYQMRHTFISYMLQIGNNPMILYRMVGHENPEIMFRKYARFVNFQGEKLLKLK